ncbi:MAG: DUF2726 domain-containing protein [Zoogloeaceae bacterium]|nr:DUF2726 domain-containing protein [Zoogloeaceae bacterium]
MKFLIVIVALALIFLLLLKVLKGRRPPDGNEVWPYYAKRPLSTPEQVLYHRLLKALPDSFVLAQVQVSRVLGVKKGFDFNVWNNRINRMSYDFVVCAPSAEVLAVIELDDSSHQRAKRRDADEKKDRATQAAGVRVMRWNVKGIPDEAEIRAALGQHAAAPAPEGPGGVTKASEADL